MEQKVDIGACLSFGMENFQKNIGMHILAAIVVIVIQSVTSGLLAGPTMLSYFIAIRKFDLGEPVEFADLFQGFNKFMPAFLAGLLGSIIIGVGTILCIIPGLVLTPLIAASLVRVQNGEDDGIKALGEAWKGMQPNLLNGTILVVALLAINLIGAILCGVGLLATVPITYAAMYKMGEQIDASRPA